jgi:hypothetical protein
MHNHKENTCRPYSTIIRSYSIPLTRRVNGEFQEWRLVSTFYARTEENRTKPRSSRSRGRYEHFPDSSLKTFVNPCRQLCTAIHSSITLRGITWDSRTVKDQKSSGQTGKGRRCSVRHSQPELRVHRVLPDA